MPSHVKTLGTAMGAVVQQVTQAAAEARKVEHKMPAPWEMLLAQFEALSGRRKILALDHLIDDIWSGKHKTTDIDAANETRELIVAELAKHLYGVRPAIKAGLECREFSWNDSGSILDFTDFWPFFIEWAKFTMGIRKYGPQM